MITIHYRDPKQNLTNRKETKTIILMKFLANEAIDILYCDGQLPYSYLSALEQKLQDYFTKELRASRKRSHDYIFIGKGIGLLDYKDLEYHRHYTLIGKYNDLKRKY